MNVEGNVSTSTMRHQEKVIKVNIRKEIKECLMFEECIISLQIKTKSLLVSHLGKLVIRCMCRIMEGVLIVQKRL